MQVLEPQTRRWTKSEYYQMAELGWFYGQRVELIEGEVVVLSPQSFEHGCSTDATTETLKKAFGEGYWVRMQLPLDLGINTEPEPDVHVVAGSRKHHTDQPTTALLIVEVSETTLSYDRRRKAGIYARAGIADYWIVNLVDRQLEVHRDPVTDDSHPFGFRYSTVTILMPQDFVTPLALPGARVPVGELFR